MKRQAQKLLEIVLVGSLLAFAGCSERKTSSAPDTAPPQTLRGQFDLYYTLQTSPTSTGGTGSTPEKVSALHFYDTYIVVEGSVSGGRVFPIDKIIHFNWSSGPRSGPAAEAVSEE
jgi:hypothetical protein